MRLSHEHMYARLLAGDATYNGRFFTGVRTTGIYCLPSCKARKPKAENVDFYPTCEAARQAGLRACRKCHPDDYARGADPVMEDIERVVAEIRRSPATFPDVQAAVKRSGFGTTRFFELCRLHYHATPADLILRSRLDHTREALATTTHKIAELAFAAGFESLSVFHDQFRRAHGLTPVAFRALAAPDAQAFRLELPAAYPTAHLLRSLGRDPWSLTERVEGSHYTLLTRITGHPVQLHLDVATDHVEVRWSRIEIPGDTGPTPGGLGAGVHALVVGLIGLGQDSVAFCRLADKLGLRRLTAGREGLRLVQTPSVFDGLLWAIIGQQINLPFAFQLRRRLFERAGHRVSTDCYLPPTPDDVARLEVSDLLPLKFSRPKASYVIDISRRITSGALILDDLAHQSASRVERTLLAVRGLGPWSVNYLMMRSLGFADCVPLGDTGVTSGLQSLLNLTDRPDVDATRRLMAVFSPYRSLATAHLWQLNQPHPT
ncbi:MAG: Ada metal-binding domain-containing protein [Opitutaceae bacterium]